MTQHRFSLLISIVLCAACTVPAFSQLSPEEVAAIRAAVPRAASVEPRQPRLVLVFNRSEGYRHSAIPRAAAALEMLGTTTGAFETVQSEDLSALSAESLKRFDAVCFNNTTQLALKDPALRASLLEFISSGKGIIGIHAATDNFPTWPEGQELFGGVFDGHPWTAEGTWAVKVADPNHPLTKAFGKQDFRITDEIYRIRQVGLRKNCRVLLALDMKSEGNRKAAGVRPGDRDLPISWVRTYGKGRLFYCSLGHNASVYANAAVLRHYLDGVQFALGDLPAPTEPVPFDPMSVYDQERLGEILRHVATYRHGDSREVLAELDAFVRSVDDRPEPRASLEGTFGAFLRGDATTAGKLFICLKLGQIGTDASVPLLSGMLADTAMSEYALLALGTIPGAAADAALLQALGRTRGHRKIGVIGVLGDRRVEEGVHDLEMLAADTDDLISAAAVSALARIGTIGALESLERLSISEKGRTDVLDAMLVAADRLRSSGRSDRALAVYRKLHVGQTPEPARSAALRGVVLCDTAGASAVVASALKSKDPVYRSAAAGLVGAMSDAESIRSLARSLPGYPPSTQVQLVAAFSSSEDPEVQKAVLTALGSKRPEVRIAAMRAAGTMATADAARPLVSRAALATGVERKQARTSLAALYSPGVDDSLLSLLAGTRGRQKAEVVRALGDRKVAASVPGILQSARDASPEVRTESIKALRALAGPEEVPVLVEMLVQSRDDTERKELESTVAAAARRNPDRGAQDSAVIAVYARAKGRDARASLLSVSGSIGAPASLPVLREALRENDREIRLASIRALSSWPTPEPFPDLWAVAAGKGKAAEKTLALRGSVRLLGLDSSRAPAEKIRIFQDAMTIAQSNDERKALLAAVGESRSTAGLVMAEEHFTNPKLRHEAEAAVLTIVESLPDTARREAVGQLRQIQSTSSIETNTKKAGDLVRQIELYDEHITSWVFAGPYRERWARLLDVPFGPEVSEIDTSHWKSFLGTTDPEKPWVLELDRNVEGQDNLVYLRSDIWSPAGQKARLELGSDAGMKVWLNDSLVHTASVVRSIMPGADTVAVRLQEGWNRLMLKLEQGDGRWRACARIRGPEGEKLERIRVEATHE